MFGSVAHVDVARFGLWTSQLEADAAAGDRASAIGDVATMRWISDRLALDQASAARVDDQLRVLEAAVDAGELGKVGPLGREAPGLTAESPSDQLGRSQFIRPGATAPMGRCRSAPGSNAPGASDAREVPAPGEGETGSPPTARYRAG
jgi:hypothetical protein